MKTCLLFIPKTHELYSKVLHTLESVVKVIVYDAEIKENTDDIIKSQNIDFVCSFLSHKILKGLCLEMNNINFHPAPPKYPGRGGASYALFNQDTTYGATAHKMVKDIDAGIIYFVNNISFDQSDTCEILYRKAELECFDLLCQFVDYLRCNNEWPSPINVKWEKKAYTSKKFKEWLMLDPNDKETFLKKIRASKHSKFPGPYIQVHGHLFSLHHE